MSCNEMRRDSSVIRSLARKAEGMKQIGDVRAYNLYGEGSPSPYRSPRTVSSGDSQTDQSAPRTQWDNAHLRGNALVVHGPSDALNPQPREEAVEHLKMWETS